MNWVLASLAAQESSLNGDIFPLFCLQQTSSFLHHLLSPGTTKDGCSLRLIETTREGNERRRRETAALLSFFSMFILLLLLLLLSFFSVLYSSLLVQHVVLVVPRSGQGSSTRAIGPNVACVHQSKKTREKNYLWLTERCFAYHAMYCYVHISTRKET